MANFQFNAQNFQPATGSVGVAPVGWYVAIIDDSNLKPTKKQGNFMLALRLSLQDPGFVNRKVFENLNVVNDNATAQQIANEQLSAYCHATGVLSIEDTSQLHGIPFYVRLKIEKGTAAADGTMYEDKNVVAAIRSIADGLPKGAVVPSQSANTTAQPQAPAQPVFSGAPVGAPNQPTAPQYTAPAQQPTAQQPTLGAQPWQSTAAQQPQPQPTQQPAPQVVPQNAPQPQVAQEPQQWAQGTVQQGGTQPATQQPAQPPQTPQETQAVQGVAKMPWEM